MPQVLWFPKIRANTKWLFLISLVILVGMWLERFVIIITSLSRDYPAVVVGSLRGHALGLRGVLRHHRLLHGGDVYLHSHHAGHFDLRNAHAAA